MCQEAVRRLCNPSESSHVRKVARLLARPLRVWRSVCSHDPVLYEKKSSSTGTSTSGGTTCSWSSKTSCRPSGRTSASCLPTSIIHSGLVPPERTRVGIVAAPATSVGIVPPLLLSPITSES